MKHDDPRTALRRSFRSIRPGLHQPAHPRNIHTLYAMPDGRVYWGEEVSTNSWDVLAGTVDPVAVIYQTGTESCGCNCDACMAGDDPAEWAGDDANELLDELIAKVDAIEVGYFDDEQ